jgi:hypothetical protein
MELSGQLNSSCVKQDSLSTLKLVQIVELVNRSDETQANRYKKSFWNLL